MERVQAGQPRVKFAAERVGPIGAPPREARALVQALDWMTEVGLSPRLEDGALAGNAALLDLDGTLWVSPSGRPAREGSLAALEPGALIQVAALEPGALIQVVAFDPKRWRAVYRSHDPDARPTSDTPLHWAMLVELALRRGWDARASLHGHVLTTDEDAQRTGTPISREATEPSTHADRAALLEVVEAHPYPAHDAWIRRGHGVFVIGREVSAARARIDALAR